MEELIFVLLGAILVTYGWYWGGVTESRSTGVATGIPAAILGGIVIFGSADIWVTAVAAVGATFGALVAFGALWETAADRTQGLFALLAALVAVLSVAALLTPSGAEFETNTFAYLVLAVAWAFVFISAGLTPGERGFRNFVGWLVLIAGAVVAFMGYAPALEITFQ